MSDAADRAGIKFQELTEIMSRLRAPDGCPWDRKQSFNTIKPYLLEETYEVIDAIDRQDWPGLAEELGDLLLQPVFLAQMASEERLFTIADALDAINQKLIRRHPHIFGDAEANTAEEVKTRWDEIKRQEKAEKGISPEPRSSLDDVLSSFPALVEALKISKKAADLGFEWPHIEGVADKVREEALELAQAREQMDATEIEHEIGDLLFTLVNLARFLKVDPEQALHKSSRRFRTRFAYIEREIAGSGGTMNETQLDRMEELWQEAKRHASQRDEPIETISRQAEDF